MAASKGADTETSAIVDNTPLLCVYLQRMRDDVSLHDVVFIVENERFPVNRCIMAAASPVFRAMLTNGMKESKQRDIELKEVNVNVWRVLLEYVYTGQIDLVNLENALRYLEYAERFEMVELEKAISSYIKEKLDATSCCEILDTVDRINSLALRTLAMNTLVAKFHVVYRTSEFTKLSYEIVLEILGCRELVVQSEIDVFFAAMNWILHSGVHALDSESSAKIATRPYEMLKQSDLGFCGLKGVESGTGDPRNHKELFDCVDLSNLSNVDLRVMARFCRSMCKEIQTTCIVGLDHMREFSESVLDTLLALYNPIPNDPVRLRDRVPHGRYDTLFTFSHRFHDVQNWIANTFTYHGQYSQSRTSPAFEDSSLNTKWCLEVYFRGYGEVALNKFVSCFLIKKSENSSAEEEGRMFNRQIYVEVDKDQSEPMVFSEALENDAILNYARGGRGEAKLLPLSALDGKDTITVGANLYFKHK